VCKLCRRRPNITIRNTVAVLMLRKCVQVDGTSGLITRTRVSSIHNHRLAVTSKASQCYTLLVRASDTGRPQPLQSTASLRIVLLGSPGTLHHGLVEQAWNSHGTSAGKRQHCMNAIDLIVYIVIGLLMGLDFGHKAVGRRKQNFMCTCIHEHKARQSK